MDTEKYLIESEAELAPLFHTIDDIAYRNQVKVLNAFQKHKVALRHFAPTTGYGYDDVGRDTLGKIFADIFETEKGLVSPLIASGTHALSLMLFGILRPGDLLLSVSGDVYDTLHDVIEGEGNGSLRDFGIRYGQVPLTADGDFDYEAIDTALKNNPPKVVFVQRSRGYSLRGAFSIEKISKICTYVRHRCENCIIAIDNCYGEFTDTSEPTAVGADICAGSMIKNPGGGIAPSGGYIVGKAKYVDAVAYRLTAPGVGAEVGSYAADYRPFYQGIFMAPHVTAQAMKGAMLFSSVFSKLGYETIPAAKQVPEDIICSIRFRTEQELISFCRTIQSVSPVDSHVTPYPWDMPGYNHQVIMAAGTFVQGASIELSADSPIKEPYIAYLQGGLTYEHIRYAVHQCIRSVLQIDR